MKNAQLWKRILNEGLADSISEPAGIPFFPNEIIKSPIIVDSRPGSRMEGVFEWEKFGPITFPFDQFWLEWQGIGPNQHIGALIKKGETGGLVSVNVLLAQASPHEAPLVVAAVAFGINPDGSVFLDGGKFVGKIAHHPAISESEKINWNGPVLTYVDAILDTLSILNCKNVSLAPRNNDPAQVKRAIKRHGGNPDSYRYHVLVVRPAGAKSDAPAQEIGIMPRHVCRGHFSEYGPQFGKGLLFGKYAGRFFIPPHMKGDKKNGVVEKDYEIRPQNVVTATTD